MMTNLLAALILAQSPGPVGLERLPFDLASLKKQEQVEVRVLEGEKSVTYGGVPLLSLLEPRVKEPRTMPGKRALSDAVLLIRATDDYRVAVSAAAVAMDPKGERYLVALTREGQPLDDRHGPLQLIIPGDPQHVRWIRNVESVHLVRLEKLLRP